MHYKQCYPYPVSYADQNNNTYNGNNTQIPNQQGMNYYMPNTNMPNMNFQEGPPTTTNIGYTPAFLKTQIGRKVRVDFLIGTNTFLDKEGTLVEVGIDYIILQETQTNNYVLGDMYSIKFVTFYNK